MVEFELPYPLSVNHYLARNARGGVRLTDKARAYQWQVLMACRNKPKFSDMVAIEIDVWFPDKRRRDLGNLDKCLIDALVKAKIITDDCWELLPDLHWRAKGIKKGGRVRVRIREIDNEFEYID